MRAGFYFILLFCACRAETALATLCIGKFADFCNGWDDYRCNHHLCHSFKRLDGVRFIRNIAKTDADFAPVVAVNHANAVGKADSVLDAESAPGVNKCGNRRVGQLDCYTRGNNRNLLRLNGDFSVMQAYKSIPAAPLVAILGILRYLLLFYL